MISNLEYFNGKHQLYIIRAAESSTFSLSGSVSDFIIFALSEITCLHLVDQMQAQQDITTLPVISVIVLGVICSVLLVYRADNFRHFFSSVQVLMWCKDNIVLKG